jgi:serine/threonine protein kinase
MSFFALKLLRRNVASGSAERRYLAREQAVLKRLSHPHILRVYDADRGLERRHVLVDYLPGPSLLARLGAAPRRRLQVVDAVTTAMQLASAVGHLHDKGYLYRDLKPANVLEGHSGSVLIDFGSVFRYRPNRVPRERLGTDPYMAPEQCLGDALSPATDVYGLGAVLYESLTGEWPFEDQLMNVFDRTLPQNRFPQIAHDVKPLRRRVANLDRRLDETVRRCLARDPADRYQSAAEVLNELLAFADGLAEMIPGAAA